METVTSIFLFCIGAAVGSFINVATRRYNGTAPVFAPSQIEGRSHCETCHRNLEWYELIPIASFLFLKGKCRTCRTRLSIQYPIVEVICGLIFVIFPLFFSHYFTIQGIELQQAIGWFYWLMSLWIAAAVALLTLSIIDFKLKIIPDELTILIVLLGIVSIIVQYVYNRFGQIDGSFFGAYALIFGVRQNIFINHIFGAIVGLVVFGSIYVVTRGKGIGLGDVKLAGALGLLFGWPDALLIFVFASLVGFVAGILLMIFRRMKMKDAIPFGPFLALGTYILWFFGHSFIEWYFGLFIGR